MPPSLRKVVAAAIGGGAIAIASVLITGPSGNDGLEGVSYIPYKDIVGVWTVCHGHTGKDIMLGKTYTKAECKTLLNKDLATVARQINPYIKVDIPETTRGALYSFVYNVGAGNFRTSTLLRKMMLPLVVVGCTSKQSVSQCVKPPPPPAWIMQPPPDWQTPLNGIISPSGNDW